jgi:hypothetical protein
MTSPGNTNNIYDRPIVPNGRNSSTVRSVSYGTDKGETLVPSVSDREDNRPPHLLSTWAPKGQTPEALRYYQKYGKSLGTFDTPEHANAYGEALHEQQAGMQNFGGRTALPPQIIKTPLQKPDMLNPALLSGPLPKIFPQGGR